MGCAASSLGNEDLYSQQRLVSDAIDRSMNINREQEKNQVKMFLLGAGESGKSTVLKQMRLLHKHLFSDFERRQYTDVIWMDLIELMKKLIFNARKFNLTLECDQPDSPLVPYKRLIVQTKGINDYGPSEHSVAEQFHIGYDERRVRRKRDETPLLRESVEGPLRELVDEKKLDFTQFQIAEAITHLWNEDSGIRKCFEMANEFQLESSASYYFENVWKFSDPSYMCSDQDIIMGRIKTTGITENDFNIKNMIFKVLDAGGQRSERKKWIHCFQNINAVLFVLAVLEYDQTLYEDERVNRMHESFALFEALCNSRWFQNTPFILFLNKVDLLEAKLKKSPVTRYFPDYDKDPYNMDKVLDYFESTLLKMNRTKKPIYVHRTCATDTGAMGFVLSAVTDMIIQQNLKQSGIM